MWMRWFVSCVGSCLDKGIGLTVIVLGDVGRQSEINLHYYNVPT